MKIIKLGLLIIAIAILTGCGEKCVRSHEEESTCAGYIWTGKSMIPYYYPCTKTVCDEYEVKDD